MISSFLHACLDVYQWHKNAKANVKETKREAFGREGARELSELSEGTVEL